MNEGTLAVTETPVTTVPDRASRIQRIGQYLFGPDPRLVARGYEATWVDSGNWFRTYEYAMPGTTAARAARFLAMRQVDYLRIGISQILNTDAYDVDLTTPYPYDTPDSDPIILTLPLTFLGSTDAREAITDLVRKRLRGQWRSVWRQDTFPPIVEFHSVPPTAHPPRTVEWALSNDPWSVFIGMTATRPFYVNIETETPHWGVTAGTGGGKTTTLALPVAHARIRMNALVDIIDLKEDSFDKYFDGVPGIRIHRTAESAVMALAEYYTSMRGVRSAGERGYDVSLIPHRLMVLDELGSFILAAENWWKYGIKGKGPPPFLAWLHMGLMQGRTKNHRFVVGTHQFSLATFKSTDARDLIACKIAIGPCSRPKWDTTFGMDTKKIDYPSNIPGRGAVGITGSGGSIDEIQLAYLTPEIARLHLGGLPSPAWFDNGELAPWIDLETIELATREGYAGPFLPGGEYITKGLSLVSGQAALQLLPPCIGDTDPIPAEVPDVPIHVTLQEAARNGVIPISYESLRKARQRDSSFPDPVGKRGQSLIFSPSSLAAWWENSHTP